MTDVQPVAAATALAGAFLAGEWDTGPMASRGQEAIGQRRAWVRRVALTVLHEYPAPPRDRPRELARFIEACPGFDSRAPAKGWLLSPTAMAADRPPWPVAPLDTVGDLEDMLGLTTEHLLWFADPKGLERTVADERLRHYRYRWAPKRSGGTRLIEEPKPLLKHIQRVVLREILAAVPAHPAAHGFRSGRSALTYVAPHVHRRAVIRLDLEDFFGSIRAGRVYGVFRLCGYPEPVARLLAGLTTNVPPRSVLSSGAGAHLPQGAPTSPALANLVAFRLDRRLATLGFGYTRYADDLAFSSDEPRVDTGGLVAKVTRLAAAEGFRVNPRKTVVRRAAQRQRLAGVVINDRPNLERREYDRIRAILHNAARYGPGVANRDAHPHFRAHLEGRVAWVGQLNPARGERLREALGRIRWDEAGKLGGP